MTEIRSRRRRAAAEALALCGLVVLVDAASSAAAGARAVAVGAAVLLFALRRWRELHRELERRHAAEDERDRLAHRLERLSAGVSASDGLLAMCSHCRSIRDGTGEWRGLEPYLEDHLKAAFSHGVCPTCLRVEYPGLFEHG